MKILREMVSKSYPRCLKSCSVGHVGLSTLLPAQDFRRANRVLRSFIIMLFFAISPFLFAMETTETKDDWIVFGETLNLITQDNFEELKKYTHKTRPECGWKILLDFFIANDGLSLMQHALVIKTPNYQTIKLLFDLGANPHQTICFDVNRKKFGQGKFYEGWTLAHIAARVRPSQDIYSLLKEAGCKFNRRDQGGWTPRDVAIFDNLIRELGPYTIWPINQTHEIYAY